MKRVERGRHSSKSTPTHASRRRERGSVLVLTLLLTLVILGIGLMAMYLSSSTTKVSSNLVRRQEAMQAARAGMAQARAVLLQMVGSGGASSPNFSPALEGSNCGGSYPTPTKANRVLSFTPGKGWVLCDGNQANAPGTEFRARSVVASGGATATAFGATSYNDVTFTAWIRNDDDEYRWCDGKQDHGEATTANADCDRPPNGVNTLDKRRRLLVDEDSRVILRVEARGRDGLSFAAIEAIISGRVPVSLMNLYQQSGGAGGQNANSVILR